MWVRWRRNRERVEARKVVADAEMLLCGEMVDMGSRAAPRVRPWMLVNVLAHAGRGDLEQLQRREGAGPSRSGGSTATMAYLAGELLSAAAGDLDLIRIQREVLVPMELSLLGREIAAPTTFVQLATLVVRALDQHPIRRER